MAQMSEEVGSTQVKQYIYILTFYFQRKILMNTAHLYGRRRNCPRVAIKALQKQLQRATWGRAAFRWDFKELCVARIEAAAYENG